MAPPSHPLLLPGALRRRAAETPDRTAYVFLADGEEEQGRLTYGELHRRARAIAAALARSYAPGERALLLYPPGLDFVAAFFGCLDAGLIAVPAYPPRSPRTMPRLLSILADARPAVALASTDSIERVCGWLARTPGAAELPWLATDELADAPEGWEPAPLDGEALAFLQYTSGSTATPKGVMVSHANLAHNQRVIEEACNHSAESVFVSWLPLYHDLGLIGNLLQATWVGAPCVLMAPVAFLQNPGRWLRAVSHYRGTTSGGPNFAYDLCVRKIPAAERERLDLTSWQVAFNGAEPVREGTLGRFAEAFAPAGFRAGALYPCYGLAEATLMVSGGRPGEAPVVRDLGGRRLVGCGHILSDLEAAIVDPESGKPVPPGAVGEIWVAGGSVAHGYWNRPQETEETFGAVVPGHPGRWLRTGDLGILDGGELFVAGRLKDLIILRGRNHYPQDLEATAEGAHPALGGVGAAFAVDAGGEEERLVIVHEVDRHAGSFEEIAAAVRRAVAEAHEAVVYEVVLVPQGGVPRTTSGKVQRRACRDLYLNGELRAVGASRLAPAVADESAEAAVAGSLDWLRRAFAAAARVDAARVDPGQPLSASGLDSLAAVELKHAVEEATGVALAIPELLEGMTLADVAQRVRQVAEGGARTEEREEILPAAGASPLSWGQRALWFLHRLAPESAAYNIAGAARIEGVDAGALHQALQALVDRHPELRATFAETPAGPVERIAERQEAAFTRVDATAWSDEEIHRRLHAEAFRPFDLAAGPVLRALLLERGSEAFLALAVHHIAADFWSLAVLARELGDLYGGAVPAPAAALYSEHARRQEAMLAGPRGERLWQFWRERLAGAPALDLPTDRPRPAVQTWNGAAETLRLPVEAVRALAAAHGATPFVVLLATWQALLARWSGQEDFLVGTPTAGRPGARYAEVVGYFVNTVALRAPLAGEPAAAEWLARVRAVVLDALEHQDLPFALLAERLQPDRDPSRPPLVETLLTLQKPPTTDLAGLASFALGEAGGRLELGALTLESVALTSPAAQFDLSLTGAETGGELGLSLQFNSDLFDATTAARMLGHLGNLLAALAEQPGQPVAELELLAPAERLQVLGEIDRDVWTTALVEIPRDRGLAGPFDDQAARTPDATAVIWGDIRETYRELKDRTDRLAAHLQGMGVGPEVLVGVFAERTPDLVTGLLGVLKAGGAYVPLDPAYPPERVGWLLEDSAAPVVLTQKRLQASLPPYTGDVVLLDQDWEIPAGRGPVPGAVHPDQTAYIIYTSGSTGRPKGVAIRHGGALARLDWAAAAYPRERLAGVLAATSVCFDLSVFELFVPLSVGGAVILADDALAFPDLPAAAEVTLVNTVPSAMAELVRAGRVPAAVRTVNLAGEPLRRELAARLYGLPGLEEVWNLYGPSEDTTYSTGGRVARDRDGAPTIGRPLPGTRVHLLDRRLGPVPVGVPGELWIGGAGLARGYLGRPDLTADRFRPDPFAAEPGGRLYRTGDLARRRADGDLDFLGRLDHQVKVRGFRIELGEIEAALLAHPAVADAVVTAPADAEGVRGLVAYVEPVPGVVADPGELRGALAGKLPEFMLPTNWVVLPALPRTPNGKVDRRALPEPAAVPSTAGGAAPRTPVEELLAGIWADLLGVEGVGVDDDFFTLGGHSLLAARVVSRLREPFGVELPLAAVFAHPTPAALAAQVELARRAAGSPALPPVTPMPRDGEIPLSFAQESLWFLDRLIPGLPVYNMPAALRLSGPLDETALAWALSEIVRRHEALRTVFAATEGRPRQVVQPPAPFALPRTEVPEAEAWRLAGEEARRPFDLAAGPLVRALLLRLAADDHLLVLTLHHTVADGWSLNVFLRELRALYGAAVAGGPSPLPELPVQYPDYAVWQRRQLSGETLAAGISWWREHLAGAPSVLALPADRPRPAVQSFRGAAEPVVLPDALVAGLRGLARRQGATLFMTVLAGFAALLHRWSGQDDVTVGSPVANRPRPELEGLIGYFVNTLPLRAGMAGDPTAAGLLARLRAGALGAYEHQDVPFERLVEELAPRRELSASPLFQVMLAVQDGAAEAPALPGLAAAVVPLGNGTAKVDLTLALTAAGSGLAGEVEWSTDLFDAATIRRMLGSLHILLAALVADPEQPLSRLPLLAPAERGALIHQGKAVAGPRGGEACLHELVAAQAERTPEAVAVESEEGNLTYRELLDRASRLARCLQDLGVKPEVTVGLAAERSPAMVAGILGILSAGGVYLPLDPELPVERLRGLLADAGAPVVVTEGEMLSSLAGPARAVPLTSSGPRMAGTAAVTPDNLAYVLYTSGSTGRPKGVGVPHRGVVSRLAAGAEAFGVGPADAMLHRASIGFDVSLWEIFTPLVAGGRLVLARPGGHREPDYLRRLVAERGVTLADFVPSALEAFLDGLETAPPALRHVFTGGEALPSALAIRCTAALGIAPVNMYGPTEASIDVLWHGWRPDDSGPTVPLGRPVPGCSAYVLDRNLEPAPAGVARELWLGGVCLARGYLGRPDLTAERFLPHPGPAEPGERLYRTGDLARLLPDGTLEFLGRVDHQVKIRGVRIEPAEIEAALRTLGLRDAAVVALGEGEGRRLAAYVVQADPQAPLDVRALRAALAATLPEAMVPASFTVLSALPLTVTGKLDRRALPEPETPIGPSEGGEPRTPVEELVAGVWADLLGRERVGRGDDFWELGGHSLLAARAAARLSRALGAEVPVRALFERSTVAALAAGLEAASSPVLPPVLPGPRPAPLSPAQERLWFLDRLEPGNPAYVVNFALRLRGILDPEALAAALAGLALRHEALRTTFTESGGRLLQEVSAEPRLPLARLDLEEKEAVRWAREEARRPFDLAAGPLARASLIRIRENEHLFLWNVHHIVFDGWSTGLFVDELSALYAAAVEGRPAALRPLPVQYADFALWQREWLAGGVLDEQLAFWRERLADAPAALDLPVDRPRPPVQTFRGGAEPLALSAELVRGLRALGRRQGATLFMVLLAGWSAVLHRASGAAAVVVGSPVANRRRPELEGLIGLFVNTLPLATDLAGDPPLTELLDRVRETALDAYGRQDVPFERLVEAVGAARDLSRSPLFQVMLAVEDGPAAAFDLPGLAVEEEPIHNGTAKLELLLALAGAGGGLAGGLEFNADLFDPATAHRLADHFQRLLAGAVAEPRLRIGDLPLLSAAEERQLRVDWNATAAPFPADRGLHELFAAQAARTPEATALVHGTERMTYRELEARAENLARHLRRLGVGPEVLVGVFSSRAPGMVAALLAVLKAGGAYLPLDPAYPQERLAFLLADTGAPVVLAEERLLPVVPLFAGEIVPLGGAEEMAGELPRGWIHPDQAAYAIYTSGSTGVPKGVIIRHGAAVARVAWALAAYPPDRFAGVLAATSICFDLSVFEIFVPLAAGGTVILADDALALPDLPAAAEVTLVNTVPSAMSELVRAGALPAAVRVVNLAGEPLRSDLAARLNALPGVEEVWNLYGPSEDTTYSTGHRLERGDSREPAIGRPLANTRVHLLDPGLRAVPVGAPGELWIGGVGLSRGYLRRPDLTADRFRPDPFSPEPGGRLYRTGDLARRRADGQLDYLGRLDHQVKLRGFRIELGEIEAALAAHPEVREAAVLALAAGGDPRLVAAVAPADVAVAELRRHLGARLPAFMVPAAFLALPALPLTPNGKVDRQALARLAAGAVREERGEYVAPRNAVEELLAPLWAEILEVDRVGAYDDFFALGGHSLAGVRLVARVREIFGVRLPVRELFSAPTLAAMAEVLAAELAAAAGEDLLDEISAEVLHG